MIALDYEQALEEIFAHCDIIMPTQNIAITDHTIIGRVLAEDLSAQCSMPKADISAMDGFAVSPPEGNNIYQIIGESAAGKPFDGTLTAGQAVHIFTGALVPQGTHCIVIKEESAVETSADGATYMRYTGDDALQTGSYIRPAGMDFKQGAIGLPKHTRLHPRHIGLMAAMNLNQCATYQAPKIAIISTGDELCLPGEAQETHQIASSNDVMLQHILHQAGGAISPSILMGDDADGLHECLAQQVKAHHMIVLTGGVSVGDYDYVLASLEKFTNFQKIFHGVNLRPGKPTLFGKIDDCLIFGLPGNPVSVLVGAMLFVIPTLKHMQGKQMPTAPIQAILADDVPAEGKRTHYRRATLYHENATLYARPYPQQDSAQLSIVAQSDGLIICPKNSAAKPAGTLVDILPFQISQ